MLLNLKRFKQDLKQLIKHGSSMCRIVNVYMISDSEYFYRFDKERFRVALPLVVELNQKFDVFSNEDYCKIIKSVHNKKVVLFSFENADVGFGYNIPYLKAKVQEQVDELYRQRMNKSLSKMESEHVFRRNRWQASRS